MLEWIGKRYMRMQTIRHEEQGFTLIELLIVDNVVCPGRNMQRCGDSCPTVAHMDRGKVSVRWP